MEFYDKTWALKSATRSALVAFSPEAPLIAAGTLAGAFDLSDASAAKLEIFKLDFQSYDPELPVVGECPSTEQFSRLSWGNVGIGTEDYPYGVIAGGLSDGTIHVWNPAKLMNSQEIEGALIARLEKKHTGNVRGLEFNPNSPNLLASGAGDGEICIWDFANPIAPSHFPPLKGAGAQDEVSFLSWNPKVQHILASTSYSGTTVVWDLKRQKPVISFSDSSRRRCSVLQWNPDAPTQLIVASDDERSPVLQMWDVRNTISPVKEFVGHNKGIMGMSWCPSDSSFLLTCAKDSRTLCWDTISGEIVCELPAGTSWNFDVQWSPRIPGVFSASSFDGKVDIYNIETCSRASGEGIFVGGAPAALLKAPKWLKRPVGVCFGFGGKLASFRPSKVSQGAAGPSEIHIHNLVTEDNLVLRSVEFEAAIADCEKTSVRALCDKKSEGSRSEEDKETWNFLRVMFEDEGNARTKLLEHLGFEVPFAENEGRQEAQVTGLDDVRNEIAKGLTLDDSTEVDLAPQAKGGQAVAFPQDNGEEFFENLDSPKEDPSLSFRGNDFTGEKDMVSNGAEVEHEAKESTEYSDYDEAIQRSLVVGDYKGAVMQCLSSHRMADALIIAHVGGSSLWEKTRDEYLRKSSCSYLKVVSAMVHNDLIGLVNSRPLKSWKETLALLCTYSQREEWTLLCDTLASRLAAAGNRLAATLCYICAGNIEKTVEIWSQSLNSDSDGRSFVDHLQDLMEKTIVLALATGQKRVSPSLSKLVESYAELLASQGLLSTAMEYLKLIGTEESSLELAILRDRIYLSNLSGTDNKEEPSTLPFETRESATGPMYGGNQETYQPAQQQPVATGLYPDGGYLQPGNASYPGSYQPAQQQLQTPYQHYSSSAQYQPSQPTQVFYPSQVPVPEQTNFAPPVTPQQVKTFVPSTPPVLKNVEQYQAPTLMSHLYPGVSSAPVGMQGYQPGAPPSVSVGPTPVQQPAVPSAVPNFMVPGPLTAPASAPRSFMPVTTPSAPQPAGLPPPVEPQSPSQSKQLQSVTAPPAPPPTIQNVDTSSVAAEIRPVISTLTRLYDETSQALGGARANPAKRREIDDNSRKIGSLFAKLNSGDISPNAASKLVHLCQALDSMDYATALQIQVGLTTSDWDECSFWLAALKRMIKTRQSMR
uniref:Sec16 Sec23-binding domain-containing protein n=1 Tax=Araucaria cunninghamii TaxID=56994 RepID=A0A0D6QV06_ARACU